MVASGAIVQSGPRAQVHENGGVCPTRHPVQVFRPNHRLPEEEACDGWTHTNKQTELSQTNMCELRQKIEEQPLTIYCAGQNTS